MPQPTPSVAPPPPALARFLGCEHRTYLDILERRGELSEERRPPDMQLLFDRGIRHEDKILQRFLEEGCDVAQLTNESADRETLAARTREAMERGAEILHQACFLRDGWV